MWRKRILGFIPEAFIAFLSILLFLAIILLLDVSAPDLSIEVLTLIFGAIGMLGVTFILALDAFRVGDSSGHKAQGITQSQEISLIKEWARQGLKYLQILLVFLGGLFWFVGSPSSLTLSFIACVLLAAALMLNIRALKAKQDFFHNTLLGVQLTQTHQALKRFSWPLRLLGVGSFVGVLALIAMPNYIGGCGSAPSISSVKANMHTFQTIVETYGVDWGGIYPENAQILQHEAINNTNAYWKDFTNPYTNYSGFGKSFADEGMTPDAGLVTYRVQQDIYGQNTSYAVYGYNKDALHIVDKGKRFYLTNDY